MTDENIELELAKETIKEIGKDIYSDGGKPIVKPTGELLSFVPRAIKAALSPVEKWILQKEYNIEETKRLLENKLQNVEPELIESPEPYIAVPALQYISYCMDNEDLRDMYATLLANSMHKNRKSNAHPAFVDTIKQLCPDEAKILKYMSTHNTIPSLDIKYTFKNGDSGIWTYEFDDVAEKAKCEFPSNGKWYFENLSRLGFVRKSTHPWFIDNDRYDDLFNCPKIKKYFDFFNNPECISKCEFIKGVYEITELAERFFIACVYDLDNELDDD